MRTLLHVGCSSQDKSGLKGFNSDDWSEIRFDIDPSVHPDIEGTLTDMDDVATESVDAIYSSHNIEHVFPHEVHTVLLEFHRVLKQDGIVVLTCPDLVSVCQAVVNDRLMETLYVSAAGPIAPIDIFIRASSCGCEWQDLYGAQDGVHLLHFAGCILQSWVQVQCRCRPAEELRSVDRRVQATLVERGGHEDRGELSALIYARNLGRCAVQRGYVPGFKSAHVLVLISLIHASEDSRLIQVEAETGQSAAALSAASTSPARPQAPSPDELFEQAQSLQQQGQLEKASSCTASSSRSCLSGRNPISSGRTH